MAEHDPKAAAARRQEQYEEMRRTLQSVLDGYQADPALIAEMLSYGARFYSYSIRNKILIHHQNPDATHVASFGAWKKMGYNVREGQKGIRIIVPTEVKSFSTTTEDGQTVFKTLREATPEEKAKIESGEIQVHSHTRFSVGTTFDISQTDCPPEDWPKIFHPGYASAQHAELYAQLKAYAQKMGLSVWETDLQSISKRGDYNPGTRTIRINQNLQDTEKLSVLTHEFGHAVTLTRAERLQEVPRPILEFEADAVSIMLQSHFGIELTRSRKDHLVNSYRDCERLEEFDLSNILKQVNDLYFVVREDMDKEVNIPVPERAAEKAEPQADHQLPPVPKPTLVVNLYGGPGAGKTTCSWEIASELKKLGYNAEYVSEYAKDLVYENRLDLLDGSLEHQRMLFLEQKHRLDRLVGKTDIVVTDSPILLSPIYLKEPNDDYLKMVRQASDQYHNFNLLIRRGATFQKEGRIHDEQQSKQLDADITRMLDENGLYYGVYNHAQIDTLVSNIAKTYRRICAEQARQSSAEKVDHPIDAAKLQRMRNKLIHAVPGTERGESAFRMTAKRLNRMAEELPDGELRNALLQAAQSSDLVTMKAGLTELCARLTPPSAGMSEAVTSGTAVAIESTEDYADIHFHSGLSDADIKNPDGSYGRTVDRFRLVQVGENGTVVPVDYTSFESYEQARAAAEQNPAYDLVDYDTIIHQAAGIRFDPARIQPQEAAPRRLFVDMDGTLAVFNKAASPEELLREGYFRDLQPMQNVVDSIREIIQKHPEIEVNILSAVLPDSPYAVAEKNAWLDEHLPEVDSAHRFFPLCGTDKASAIPGGIRENDYLLDDYTHNLNQWWPPEHAIKLLNGINDTRGSWQHSRVDAASAPDKIAADIAAVIGGEELNAKITTKQDLSAAQPRERTEKVHSDAAPPSNRMSVPADREEIRRTSRGQTGKLAFEASHREMEFLKYEVSILTVAADMGFTPERFGGYYTLKEHDSVRIYPETNTYYRWSTGRGGSTVDFVINLGEMTKRKAIEYLKERYIVRDPAFYEQSKGKAKRPEPPQKERKPFVLPERFDGKYSRVMAYLTKTRELDADIVKDCIRRNLIYEDTRHNAVFVGYDANGKAAYATKRTTMTQSHYRGDVAGSDQSVGWKLEHPGATKLYVTEAPIDALSVATMRKMMGEPVEAANYIATCGTGKSKVVEHYLAEHPEIQQVVLANDADAAGQEANQRLNQIVHDVNPEIAVSVLPPKEGCKDMNDTLKAGKAGLARQAGQQANFFRAAEAAMIM